MNFGGSTPANSTAVSTLTNYSTAPASTVPANTTPTPTPTPAVQQSTFYNPSPANVTTTPPPVVTPPPAVTPSTTSTTTYVSPYAPTTTVTSTTTVTTYPSYGYRPSTTSYTNSDGLRRQILQDVQNSLKSIGILASITPDWQSIFIPSSITTTPYSSSGITTPGYSNANARVGGSAFAYGPNSLAIGQSV